MNIKDTVLGFLVGAVMVALLVLCNQPDVMQHTAALKAAVQGLRADVDKLNDEMKALSKAHNGKQIGDAIPADKSR